MEINDAEISNTSKLTSKVRGDSPLTTPKLDKTPITKDVGSSAGSVELTSLSKLSNVLSTIETQAGGAPVDAKRVDEIKGAIEAGTFRVNTDIVAKKLIEAAAEA